MTCLRPATPGFVITLVATILLAVVSFCVPYVRSVYFLRAAIDYQGVSGNITFGTLGYCLDLAGNTTCSKPSIGYRLDINRLVGNNLPVQIPQVVVQWTTYLLFLHVVALVAAAVSAGFGLLAHVREMSMICCSTWFSGFAAVITLIVFIIDIVLFSVVKARINAIGHAQLGNAVWLTLAAWFLLFFSGCFFTLGRSCLKRRKWPGKKDDEHGPDKDYSQQMRLDAVKAEADRKARQKQQEVGLPAFNETQPLTGDHLHPDGDNPDPSPPATAIAHRGYAPGRPGTRAVDDYHRNNSIPASTMYPPQPEVRRQQSQHSAYSATTPFGYGQYDNTPLSMSPPSSNSQLHVPSQRYNSTSPDPYGREYGHMAGGTSYHTAISHDQGPSAYGQPPHESYAYQPQSDPYMPTFTSRTPVPFQPITSDYYPPMPTSTSPPPIQQPQPLHGDRSYTLGGDGYGSNQLPPLPEHQPTLPPGVGSPPYQAFGQQQHRLPPIDTDVAGQHFQTRPGWAAGRITTWL